jgi:3-deoxy-manno-octulosonate cytidylyltransferase (CMP-KDO synthetase)
MVSIGLSHSSPAGAANPGGGGCVIVIPSRLAATRLPNKPLADIHGEPMILHVWRRAAAAGIGPVIVATADRAIQEVIEAAGGRAVLTDPALPSGSDRVFAAVELADPERRFEIVINVQGDLPTIEPGVISRALEPLADPAVDIATPVHPSSDEDARGRASIVKAVVAWRDGAPGTRSGRALYFSRAATPWGEGPLWHHVGLYAFRRAALARFVALPPSGLEKRENLEQLRALEAGMRIDVVEVPSFPLGVDTPDDLEEARRQVGRLIDLERHG